MSSIRAIDVDSIEKICSGQVIVDLATAVKELVENSLDANATNIDIKLKECGLTSIEVCDNGDGIDPSNFEGLGLKHHTSKILNFNDLSNVSSFGFRGEALNALCALSGNISITTKHTSSNLGSTLSFAKDGKLLNQKVAARSNGTTILIENLFESLPVRRSEFTRSIKKHFQKLVRILYSYAIISVGVKINLVNLTNKGSKQVLISTQASKQMSDNITSIFGSKFFTSLTPLQLTVNNSKNEIINDTNAKENAFDNSNDLHQGNFNDFTCSTGTNDNIDHSAISEIEKSSILSPEDGDEICNISGYISKAGDGVGRSDNDRQFTFINGRPVDLSKFIKVVNEAWRRYEMKSKPACVLDIRVPPGSFDVNLTPDKREVVLMNESKILDKLRLVIDELYAPSRYTFQLSQGLSGTQQDTLFDYSFTGPAATSSSTRDEDTLLVPESQHKVDEIDNPFDEKESNQISLKQKQTEIIWMTNIEKETRPLDAALDQTDIDSILSSIGKENIRNGSPDKSSLLNETKGMDIDSDISMESKAEELEINNESRTVKRLSSEVDIRVIPEIVVINDDNDENEDVTTVKRFKTETSILSPREESLEPSTIWKIDTSDTLATFRKVFCLEKSATSDLAGNKTEIERISLLKSCSLDNNHIDDRETDIAAAALSRVLKKDDFLDMRIIGQFNLGFIIAELNGDLYLLDQHACDEKYRFETLQQNTTIHQQPLIVPLPLEGSAAEEMVIIDNLKIFEENGFKFLIDENGTPGSKIKLTALPFSKSVQFGIQDVHELASLLSDYSNDDESPYISTVLLKNTDSKSKVTKLPKLLSMFASRACRSAVMIGTALQKNEMKTIVEKMATLDQPWNCPHGRPTMRHLAQLPK